MIDMKALLADREAGTPGPWEYDADTDSVLTADGYEVCWDATETNARRIARVPDLEQALIDARAALIAVKDYVRSSDELLRSDKGFLAAICKKGLGE